MASSYNPNAPGTLGLEWMVATRGADQIIGDTGAIGILLRSTVAETINQIVVPSQWFGPDAGYTMLWCDVYDLSLGFETEVPTTTRYQPNEDHSGGTTAVVNQAGSASNLYQSLDESDPDDDTDYIVNTSTTPGGIARFHFNTAAFATANRVVGMYLEARLRGVSVQSFPYLQLEWWFNNTFYRSLGRVGPSISNSSAPFITRSLGPLYISGDTLQPMCSNDIVNFDNNALLNIAVRFPTPSPGFVWLSRLQMRVDTVVDKRVASGWSTAQLVRPSGIRTAIPFNLQTPSTNQDNNWAKAAGKDYLIVVRRVGDPYYANSIKGASNTINLLPALVWIDSNRENEYNPRAVGDGYDVTMGASGIVTAISARKTKTYAVIPLVNATNVISVDHQGYNTFQTLPIYTGSSPQQFTTTPNPAGTYKYVRAMIAVKGAVTAGLRVKVQRSSDNVQFGTTGTFTAAQLAVMTPKGIVDGISWYEVLIPLPTVAVLAASTSYYMRFESDCLGTVAADGSQDAWAIAEPDATFTITATGDPTFNGSTDTSRLGTSHTLRDLAAQLQTQPAAPLTASVSLTAVTRADTGSLQDATSASYPVVRWTRPSTLGATFGYYLIERSDDGGTTYASVWKITGESTLVWTDHEAFFGRSTKYRVSIYRSDGAGSDPTVTTAVTPPVSGCAVRFSSNYDQTQTVYYDWFGPTSTFEFPDAGDVVYVKPQGRDFQLAERPTEQRGVVWPVRVMVFVDHDDNGSNAPAAGKGTRAFAPLRDLVRDTDLPYVCVTTPEGDRFFGSIIVPTATITEPSQLYVLEIKVTEVTQTPSVGSSA